VTSEKLAAAVNKQEVGYICTSVLQNAVFPDALQQERQIVFCGAKDSKKPVLGLGAATLWLGSGGKLVK